MSLAKSAMRRQLAGRSHRGTTALNFVLEVNPGMFGFSLFVEHIDDPRESEWPGSVESDIWNDGKRIHYAPQFAEREIKMQISILTKHLLKIALCHSIRARRMKTLMGDAFQPRIYVLASDLVVHQTMDIYKDDEKSKKYARLKPTLNEVLERYTTWCKNQELPEPKLAGPSEWSVEQVYYFLSHWRDELKKLAKENNGIITLSEDDQWLAALIDGVAVDLDWDSPEALEGDSTDSTRSRDDEAMRNWANRLERAKAGDKPGGMLRRISGDLPAVKTPWDMLLRTTVNRAISRRPREDWTRPSRNTIARMAAMQGDMIVPFEPARMRGAPSPKIAILIDTSGSIGDDILDIFAANMNGIQRAKKTQIRVIVGDTGVEEVVDVKPEQFRDVCKNVKFVGGGGTDFRPLIAEALKWKPDVIVFLTDLAGTFPAEAPKVPFIWAAIPIAGMNAEMEAPFGKVIMID